MSFTPFMLDIKKYIYPLQVYYQHFFFFFFNVTTKIHVITDKKILYICVHIYAAYNYRCQHLILEIIYFFKIKNLKKGPSRGASTLLYYCTEHLLFYILKRWVTYFKYAIKTHGSKKCVNTFFLIGLYVNQEQSKKSTLTNAK